MRTTVDLPEDLVLQVREYATRTNRTLKSAYADLLRRGLIVDQDMPSIQHRVKLPLIKSTNPVRPGQGLTPEQIKDLLLEEDVRHYFEAMGRTPPEPRYE